MVKQRLERDFVNAMKKDGMLYILKLYHVMGRYTTTPADFIVLTENYKYLVECKECRGKAFIYERLTQKQELLEFKNYHYNNIGLILFCFWNKSRKSSIYYLIPIELWSKIEGLNGKKSMNIGEFEENFPEYKVDIDEINSKFI